MRHLSLPKLIYADHKSQRKHALVAQLVPLIMNEPSRVKYYLDYFSMKYFLVCLVSRRFSSSSCCCVVVRCLQKETNGGLCNVRVCLLFYHKKSKTNLSISSPLHQHFDNAIESSTEIICWSVFFNVLVTSSMLFTSHDFSELTETIAELKCVIHQSSFDSFDNFSTRAHLDAFERVQNWELSNYRSHLARQNFHPKLD